MELSQLRFWRRRRPAARATDPSLRILRYSQVLRVNILSWSAFSAAGLAAVATDPIPRGVPLSAVYAVVNVGFAVRGTHRDLGSVAHAHELGSGTPVSIAEPLSPFRAFSPLAIFLCGWAYFSPFAVVGRFVLAGFVPQLVQFLIVAQAVRRRESDGVDLYLHDEEVRSHPHLEPLNVAA